MNDERFEFLTDHDLEIFKVYNAGDYERENLVLIANKDISSLYNYILVCMVDGRMMDCPIMINADSLLLMILS